MNRDFNRATNQGDLPVIHEMKYDWVLEGDLDTTVSLVLSCDCIVSGLRLASVRLKHVVCENLIFSLKRKIFSCDQLDSPSVLPIELQNWFVERFLQSYAGSHLLQHEIQNLIESQAISGHWEAKSAA